MFTSVMFRHNCIASGVARGGAGGANAPPPNFRSSVFPQNADKYRPTYHRIKTHVTGCSLPCCAE